MKFRIVVCVIWLMYLLCFCNASLHKFGENFDYGMRMVYSRTLIDDINKVPKNYTIIYKYLGALYTEVAHLEVDVNVESEARYYGKKNIEIKITINNASNVTATIQIYKYGSIQMPQFNWIRLTNGHDTRSITFIHTKNASPSKIKQFAQNAIGRRRQGDTLLHFESRNVTNGSRFPSRAFEYSNTDQCITYVGFSFNSPTAMVMINTSFVDEQEFNAVAYDMNTDHFVANMSVYGIESPARRPFQFEGVI